MIRKRSFPIDGQKLLDILPCLMKCDPNLLRYKNVEAAQHQIALINWR